MSFFIVLFLIFFWSAILAIPCIIAYNAAVAGEPTIAALFLFILVILGGTVAGSMSNMFGWEATTIINQTKSAKGVEAMKNIIVKRKLDGEIAVITHWDHFHVNRYTGSTMNRSFTIKVLSGNREGNSYVWPIGSLHGQFEVVGMNSEETTKAS